MDELKNCPFCGSKPSYTENISSASVFCSCGASFIEYKYNSENKKPILTNKWNKRA